MVELEGDFFDTVFFDIPDVQPIDGVEASAELVVIVRGSDLSNVDAELLTKILKSIGYDKNDYAIITVEKDYVLALNNLSNCPADKILVFGNMQDILTGNIRSQANVVLNLWDKQWLQTFSLTELQTDVNNKKILWKALQAWKRS